APYGQPDRGGDRLTEETVRDAVAIRIGNGAVLAQPVFDLLRRDVLAAADDQVLDAAGDPEIAVGIHARFVAGVQPAFVVDCRLRGGVVVVVRLHHVVAAAAQ